MRKIHTIFLLKSFIAFLLVAGSNLNLHAQTIPVAETDAVNNTAANAMPIQVPAKVRGNVFPNADVDYYSFSANAGDKCFAALMTAFSSSASTTSRFTLVGPDGSTVIETDTENGTQGTLSSSIAGAVIPATGTYYLRVEHFNVTTQIRGYDLYVVLQAGAPLAPTEPNEITTEATPLPVNGFVSGVKDSPSDVDVYSFTLAAGETVFVSLDLNPSRGGFKWNGRVGVGLFGDANNQILRADDAGTIDANPSEALFVTAKNAGTYYVYVDAATAIGDPSHTYELSVKTFAAQQGYVNYASADVPKTIPAGSGNVTSTITIPDSKIIKDISIRIDLNHQLMADIDAVLTTPTGEMISLFTDVGSTAVGGQQIMNLVINDYNAAPFGSPLQAVVNGIGYQPELNSKLAQLYNRNAAGTWTLTLYDDLGNAAGGTLNNWSMDILEQTAPVPLRVIASEDFEGGDGGFTSSGTANEWEYGTPATPASPGVAALNTANSGTKCWKTDLDNTYDINSNQVLQSPVYDLTAEAGNIVLSYAMKYSLESAQFDGLTVSAEEVGGTGLVQNLFNWLGATQTASVGSPAVNIGASGGWITYYADISAFAGKQFQLKFRLTSDASVNLSGVGVDDVRIFTPNATLPYNNNLLKGQRTSSGNQLQWQVACGANASATVILERSSDGLSFIEINQQTASLARCETPFYYTDGSVVRSKNYYRVKVITADGKIAYTNVVMIRNNEAGLQFVKLSPNPVVGSSFNLQLTSAGSGTALVTIIDTRGSVVSRQNVQLVAGSNAREIACAALAAGVYYVNVTDKHGNMETIKMIKK